MCVTNAATDKGGAAATAGLRTMGSLPVVSQEPFTSWSCSWNCWQRTQRDLHAVCAPAPAPETPWKLVARGPAANRPSARIVRQLETAGPWPQRDTIGQWEPKDTFRTDRLPLRRHRGPCVPQTRSDSYLVPERKLRFIREHQRPLIGNRSDPPPTLEKTGYCVTHLSLCGKIASNDTPALRCWRVRGEPRSATFPTRPFPARRSRPQETE